MVGHLYYIEQDQTWIREFRESEWLIQELFMTYTQSSHSLLSFLQLLFVLPQNLNLFGNF